MPLCLFAADLHGQLGRYRALSDRVLDRRPAAVFLGGDLLPGGCAADSSECSRFVGGFLAAEFLRLRAVLGRDAPRVFLILGNDDPRAAEPVFVRAAEAGAWECLHGRRVALGDFDVHGYSYVPPSPFLLKDWERYDVSRHVDPGCVSPEEGVRTVAVEPNVTRYATIRDDLAELAGDRVLDRSVFLFHAPPYDTPLDRAALDERRIDHAPLDVHVGSVAIRRFIEQRQPRLTLHGHIHESARITGQWTCSLGRTICLSAAHDGPELALVEFDPERPDEATRSLIRCD